MEGSQTGKRKSGDWEDDKPVAEKITSTAAKKLKADAPAKDVGRPVKSALPRFTASTRSKAVSSNPAPAPAQAAAPVVATPSANNATTPRAKGYARIQTPAREILRPTGAEAAIQDTLAEI
eukprot:gene35266-42729_t